MCDKCKKALASKDHIIKNNDLTSAQRIVPIMDESILDFIQKIRSSAQAIGVEISVANIAIVFGWFYYTVVQNHIEDGLFTSEEFEAFDTAFKASIKEGVKDAVQNIPDADTIIAALSVLKKGAMIH